MVLPLIFGLLILAVVVYIALRVLGNVLYGVVLIALIFFASFLIIGSFPDLKQVPIIGDFIPDLPDFSSLSSATGNVINVVRGLLYNLKILSVGRSSAGNLLVTVANAGRLELSGFNVSVDNKAAGIANAPKSPLKSGESTVIEATWTAGFSNITVQTAETFSNYP